MRTVGKRREPELHAQASSAALVEGALFNEAIARLSPGPFIPKGVYRFSCHEEANRHAEECLIVGMARVAAARAGDG